MYKTSLENHISVFAYVRCKAIFVGFEMRVMDKQWYGIIINCWYLILSFKLNLFDIGYMIFFLFDNS